MKLLSAVLAASLLVVTGCKTDPTNMNNHWRLSHVPDRLNYHFLNGYDSHNDGLWRDYQWEMKADINNTFKRHMLSANNENPFSYGDHSAPGDRPLHSPLPNPWNYFHVESLVMGAIMLNPSVGIFLAIPVGSVMGTLEDDEGLREFGHGFKRTSGFVTASFSDEDGDGKEAMRATWTPVELRRD